jgi:uncharacterized protein (DUF488 family)
MSAPAAAGGPDTELLTIGHGASSQEDLGDRLVTVGVQLLVDIRRFPGSRAHPHVAREALAEWLPLRGVSYRWEPRLGGRRSLPKDAPTPDTWWTVEAFRAYAAHTRTREFSGALDELLHEAGERVVAVMCSETVWWRCHRRLVADVAVLAHGVEVRHVMPGRAPSPHRPAAGARLRPDGQLVWDDGAEA